MPSRLLAMMDYMSPMSQFNRMRSRKRTHVVQTPTSSLVLQPNKNPRRKSKRVAPTPSLSPETESPSPETESPPTRKSTRSTTQRTRKSTNPDVIRAVAKIEKVFADHRNIEAKLKDIEEKNSKIRTKNIKTRAARSAAIVRQFQNMKQISEADYDNAKIKMDKLYADNINDLISETKQAKNMLDRMVISPISEVEISPISKGGKNSKRSRKYRRSRRYRRSKRHRKYY